MKRHYNLLHEAVRRPQRVGRRLLAHSAPASGDAAAPAPPQGNTLICYGGGGGGGCCCFAGEEGERWELDTLTA